MHPIPPPADLVERVPNRKADIDQVHVLVRHPVQRLPAPTLPKPAGQVPEALPVAVAEIQIRIQPTLAPRSRHRQAAYGSA